MMISCLIAVHCNILFTTAHQCFLDNSAVHNKQKPVYTQITLICTYYVDMISTDNKIILCMYMFTFISVLNTAVYTDSVTNTAVLN